MKTVTDYWYATLFQPGAPDQTMYCGFLGMEAAFNAIGIAIREKGGDLALVTGEDVKNAFGTVKDWQGVVHPKTSMGPDDRSTFSKVKIYEVQQVGEDLTGVDISGPLEVTLMPRLEGGQKPQVDWAAWSP